MDHNCFDRPVTIDSRLSTRATVSNPDLAGQADSEISMPIPSNTATPAQRLRTIQIINLTLAMGVLFFLAIAVFLRQGGNMAPPPALPLITYIALAYAVVMLAAYYWIPNLVAVGMRKKMIQETDSAGRVQIQPAGPDPRWYDMYQTWSIIGSAILEGASFFLIMAFLLEGIWLSLVAVAVPLGILATKFPTLDGIERWIERQRETL
jgi:hypothetical protein